MTCAYVVNGSVPGREMKTIEYGAEVQEYRGKLTADGKCSEPEMFFAEIGKEMALT